MYLVAENILSDGIYMAGIARYSLAILAKVEKWLMFLFHQANGSSFLSMYSALQYKDNSFSSLSSLVDKSVDFFFLSSSKLSHKELFFLTGTSFSYHH